MLLRASQMLLIQRASVIVTSRERDVTYNVQRASAFSLTRRYAFANGPIRTP